MAGSCANRLVRLGSRWSTTGHGPSGCGPSRQPRREQTDESLRIEREKSDTAAGAEQRAIEVRADAVVRVAR